MPAPEGATSRAAHLLAYHTCAAVDRILQPFVVTHTRDEAAKRSGPASTSASSDTCGAQAAWQHISHNHTSQHTLATSALCPIGYQLVRVQVQLLFLLKVPPARPCPDQVPKLIMHLRARSRCPRIHACINNLILRLLLNHLPALRAVADVPRSDLVPVLVIMRVPTSNVPTAEVWKRSALRVQCTRQNPTRGEPHHAELLPGRPGEVEARRISGEKAKDPAHLLGRRTTLTAEVPKGNIGWPADEEDAVPGHNLVLEEPPFPAHARTRDSGHED